jgi:hypothetical protein
MIGLIENFGLCILGKALKEPGLQELKSNLRLLYNFKEICFSICKKCKILFMSEKDEEIGSDVKEI